MHGVIRFSLTAVAAFALGCARRPSDAELDGLAAEARTENTRLATKYARPTERTSWTLSIAGQATGLDLDFARLDALATTHVRTSSPVRTRDTAAVVDYRGVLLSTLLDLAHADRGAKTLTFVASDGFVSTVDVADARRFPIVLAVELDGKPIARADGGPLLLTFPETEFPEVRAKYHEVSWCFYPTYLIVGREPTKLDVDGTVLGEQRLSELPQATFEGDAKFRFGWPTTKVTARGPRLRDVLVAAGKNDRSARVRIEGKPRATGANDWVLGGAEATDCEAIVATSFGPEGAAIPAAMGGPLVVVVPDGCHLPDAHWPMFVAGVRLERSDAGAPEGGP